ncbi:MAG: phage/plasmid primase, P4 family, partial [Planctomycetaceae bacterium]
KTFDPPEIEKALAILEGLPDRSDDSRFAAEAPEPETKQRSRKKTSKRTAKSTEPPKSALCTPEEIADADTIYIVQDEASVSALKDLGYAAVAVDVSVGARAIDWAVVGDRRVIFMYEGGNEAVLFIRRARWLLHEQGATTEIKCFTDDTDYEPESSDGFDPQDAASWREHHKDKSDAWLKERLESLPDQGDCKTFAAEAPESLAEESNHEMGDDEVPNPSLIADALLCTEFSRDGECVLIQWQGDFHRWQGAWLKMEADELKSIVGKWLNRTFENPSPYLITSVITFLQTKTFLPGTTEPNTWLNDKKRGHRIAVDNGLLNPETNELEDSTPNWFSPVILPVVYDTDATCDRWLQTLHTNLEGDLDRISILQEFAGYLLWPNLEFQKFLTLVGEGANGKSVFIAGLQALLGNRNVSNYSLETLGTNRFAIAGTIGKLANLCADINEVTKISEGVLKQLVSGDRQTVDRKNRSQIEVNPTAKLVFSCNNLPRFKDRSSGMTRRMIIVPFNREVPVEERVQGLDRPEAWTDELSGMLNWSLEGLQRLLKNRSFTHSRLCDETLDEYREDNNPTSVFINDYLIINEDPESYVLKSDAYRQYRAWCETNGRHPFCDSEFAKEIRRVHKGIKSSKKTVNGFRQPVFLGLRLLLRPNDSGAQSGASNGFGST